MYTNFIILQFHNIISIRDLVWGHEKMSYGWWLMLATPRFLLAAQYLFEIQHWLV